MLHKYIMPLTLACALCLGPLPALAQEEDRVAQLEERTAEIRERMKLSDAQKTQIAPIMEAHIEAIAAVLDDHGIDFQERSGERKRLKFREMRALRKDLDAVRANTAEKMSGILTEEQMEEYRKIQAEWKAELRKRIRDRRNQK